MSAEHNLSAVEGFQTEGCSISNGVSRARIPALWIRGYVAMVAAHHASASANICAVEEFDAILSGCLLDIKPNKHAMDSWPTVVGFAALAYTACMLCAEA